jgi:hypothetical protein
LDDQLYVSLFESLGISAEWTLLRLRFTLLNLSAYVKARKLEEVPCSSSVQNMLEKLRELRTTVVQTTWGGSVLCNRGTLM